MTEERRGERVGEEEEGTKERSAEGRGPKSAGMRNWAECGGKSEESRGCGPGRRMGGSGGNGVENAERTKVEKPGGRNSEERDGGDRWKKKGTEKKEKK